MSRRTLQTAAPVETDLFRRYPAWPEGLEYQAEFIAPHEEKGLIAGFCLIAARAVSVWRL
jgi:hypothetical protein